jgi:hypothetical protein
VSEQQNDKPLTAGSEATGPDGAARSRRSKASAPEPTISAFFSEARPSVSVFAKVLKSNKVTRFAETDASLALERMQANDPDGARLWVLMSQANAPEAVDRWVWIAAQHRLTQVLGEAFDPTESSAGRILDHLIAVLGPASRSKEKATSRPAEHWLRIGICWLIEKRNLDPWTVAERLSQVLFVDQKRALRLAARTITRGKSGEFKLAVAIVAAADSIIKNAKSEREAEQRISLGLRRELQDALMRIDQLKIQLSASTEAEKKSLDELQAVRARFEGQRQHWGHEVSELEAAHRVLLGERVVPLIRDVIDALDIDPPAMEVARRRLRSALELVLGESK